MESVRRSTEISVTDVPRVERLEITYRYPAYTGMQDFVETEGGDIIALRGTTVTLVAHTDVPATGGQLVFDDGTSLAMKGLGERKLQAILEVSKDAQYHIRLRDHLGKQARASHEYIIQALEDSPPNIRLARPGRDMQPTPIEEVVAALEAEDDVRLAELQLHYSVNGSTEETVILGQGGRDRQISADHTFFLEDFHLVPGDLVSFYGVAEDAAANITQTDMFFLQVRPFEKTYRQSQAGGGGGGGGMMGENTFLSERQKEVVSATWNVIRKHGQRRPDQSAEDAQVLSAVQRTLQEQAETLASRVSRRQLSGVNEEFAGLVENLRKAAQMMEPAAQYLEQQKFQEALSPEQTALQHLLRAEALFRDIQVAFGSAGGGRGGAGNSGRDLADLFALELDTDKNQYETLREQGRSAIDDQLDEVMRKLQELARRQEQLARQEPGSRKDSLRAASRWDTGDAAAGGGRSGSSLAAAFPGNQLFADSSGRQNALAGCAGHAAGRGPAGFRRWLRKGSCPPTLEGSGRSAFRPAESLGRANDAASGGKC